MSVLLLNSAVENGCYANIPSELVKDFLFGIQVFDTSTECFTFLVRSNGIEMMSSLREQQEEIYSRFMSRLVDGSFRHCFLALH